ncbi:DUF5701 family protein [Mycobacterium sp. IDR2000157661]|uniref:DUF5701 family protein n=1 Tax=Mycobacterium sp. IDR2000157661 TaxID=2867005 RepID=UPI001EEB16BF|nr:DUF5701 family protein [Mycobacterium sp. IDR2000157661]ULE32387.1 hypothetical protein K3G64_20025 [Mycobacterium sp. IDR2000157661]
MPTTATTTLPALALQAETLITLGVAELAGIPVQQLRDMCRHDPAGPVLLAVHPELLAPSALAPLIRRDGKPGFVVADMADLDEFGPIPSVALPDSPVYAVCAPDRGDAMANWSPDEALPAIVGAGRTALTVSEGLHWVLQQPDVLQRNRCFMTIGSRLPKHDGSLDARTPALWISNGTGRDGAANRDAPKVGWCWAGNRHTWLGFASAARRDVLSPPG